MENDFIRKVYLKALIPNVIAVLGGTINVFFDAVFVGQKLGSGGLESVNQCLPIYLLLCTIGSLFASGASCLSAIAFGENKKKESVRIFRAATLASAGTGILLCAAGLLLAAPIGKLLSTQNSYPYVLTYLRITLAGGVFKVLLYIPYFYLRLEGKNRRSAAAMLTMTVLNILLDYVFLFRLDMGIAGAAWASVIATAVAVTMSFCFLFTDHSNFTFGIELLTKSDFLQIAKFGSPMALNNILSSARIFAINLILKSTGISGLTSIFAIVNNISEFSICVQNGVPQTASAMTGIFFGEKDSASVKKTLNIQLLSGTVLSLLFGGILVLFSGKMGAFFGTAEDASAAILCLALSLPFATANNVLSYYCNSTGRISLANMITVLRGFVAVTGFCLILSPFGEKVWLFYPLGELVTTAAYLVTAGVMAGKKKLMPFYLLDDKLEKSGQSISFAVPCVDEKICLASEQIQIFCEDNHFSPKATMAVSLALEEILSIISRKSLGGKGTMDVRVLKYGDKGIIRIRSGGKRYNPIEAKDDSPDYMGVEMIVRLSERIEYHSSLGVNTLMIFI